jgi:DNA-binding NarL/FixJ family response regulator
MNLLIIDDHMGYRVLIRELVARPGDLVRECQSGEMALEALAEFAPDWVTVDLVLPHMDGFATIKAVRKACPTARIVMVSGYDDPECSAMAMTAGAEAFVGKAHLPRLRELIPGTTGVGASTKTFPT